MALCDVTFHSRPDPIMEMIAKINGNSNQPKRIQQGMYIIGHWNPETMVVQEFVENWGDDHVPLIAKNGEEMCHYGVCDNPEQLLEYVDLETPDTKYVVFLVEIRREAQEPQGGWRFHKWGPYIGSHDIQYEYLYDQKDIDRVFTYHIYRLS